MDEVERVPAGTRMPRILFGFAIACWLSLASGALQAQTTSCAIATHAEKIGNGTIVYNVVGSGADILLIHGLFANKEQWNRLACLLADAGFTAIAIDLPGYGKSQPFPLADYTLEREVENLHALMARLRITDINLAGNSMGGAIASLYASRYPGQVRSLAFLGSPQGITRWGQGVVDAIDRGINPFIPTTVAQLELELGLLFVTPPRIPLASKKSIVADYAARYRHYVQVWDIVNLYGDILTRQYPAKIPTLIVWGNDDRIFDVAGAQELQHRIPGSELHVLPHAGHLLHLEDAAEVAPIYISFVRAAASTPTKRDSVAQPTTVAP